MEGLNDKIVLYCVKDIQEIFKCGQRQAYAIMNSSTFPSFKINSKAYVYEKDLIKWIEKNKGKEIFIEQ